MADVRTSHTATSIPPRGPRVGFQGMTREKRIEAARRGGRVRGKQMSRDAKKRQRAWDDVERAERARTAAQKARAHGKCPGDLWPMLVELSSRPMWLAERSSVRRGLICSTGAMTLRWRGLVTVRVTDEGLVAYITALGRRVIKEAT